MREAKSGLRKNKFGGKLKFHPLFRFNVMLPGHIYIYIHPLLQYEENCTHTKLGHFKAFLGILNQSTAKHAAQADTQAISSDRKF